MHHKGGGHVTDMGAVSVSIFENILHDFTTYSRTHRQQISLYIQSWPPNGVDHNPDYRPFRYSSKIGASQPPDLMIQIMTLMHPESDSPMRRQA